MTTKKILYCRCAFAKVIPDDTKDAVLEKLCESGAGFETVSDLCEMSARKDPRLASLIEDGESVRIAACYPRAVKWLFHNAGISADVGANGDSDGTPVQVLNMREQSAAEIVDELLKED